MFFLHINVGSNAYSQIPKDSVRSESIERPPSSEYTSTDQDGEPANVQAIKKDLPGYAYDIYPLSDSDQLICLYFVLYADMCSIRLCGFLVGIPH